MNFNFGETLARAWQITWKHKLLWVIVAAPLLFSLVYLPAAIPLFFLNDQNAFIMVGVAVILFFLAFIINYMLGSVTMAAATLGIARIERGEGSVRLTDLIRDGLRYFWRVLTAMLAINLTFGMAISIFFLVFLFLVIVTIGLASICLQPVMLLVSPLSFLVVAIIENSLAAIVVHGLNAMDALQRALQLVRRYFWTYILITLVIYLGTSILSSVIMAPLMVPFFALSFLSASADKIDTQMLILVSLAFTGLFIPLLFVFQSIVGTFMKSALVLTYLRLAENHEDQVVLATA